MILVIAALLIFTALLQPAEGQMPPANDNFANAIEVVLANGEYVSDPIDNTDATMEVGEPTQPDEYTTGRTVWWKFAPTTTGAYQVDTMLTDDDTEMGIFTGSSVDTLTRVGGNSDGGPGYSSVVPTIWLTAGTTYYIQVGGYNASAITSVVLRVKTADFGWASSAATIPNFGDNGQWIWGLWGVGIGNGVGVLMWWDEDPTTDAHHTFAAGVKVNADLSVTVGTPTIINTPPSEAPGENLTPFHVGNNVVVVPLQDGDFRTDPQGQVIHVHPSTLAVTVLHTFGPQTVNFTSYRSLGAGDPSLGRGFLVTADYVGWITVGGSITAPTVTVTQTPRETVAPFDSFDIEDGLINGYAWVDGYLVGIQGFKTSYAQNTAVGLQVWSVDWDARTFGYQRSIPLDGYWTQFGEHASVIPGLVEGTVDVLYAATSDKYRFCANVPITSTTAPPVTATATAWDLAQANYQMFYKNDYLFRIGEGRWLFNYIREYNNDAYGVLLEDPWLGYEAETKLNTEDHQDTNLWLRGVPLLDLGLGRMLVAWTPDLDVIKIRAGFYPFESGIPPLRLSQRDDILSLVDGSGPRIKGHNQTRSQQDTRTARLKGLSLAGGGQRYL